MWQIKKPWTLNLETHNLDAQTTSNCSVHFVHQIINFLILHICYVIYVLLSMIYVPTFPEFGLYITFCYNAVK